MSEWTPIDIEENKPYISTREYPDPIHAKGSLKWYLDGVRCYKTNRDCDNCQFSQIFKKRWLADDFDDRCFQPLAVQRLLDDKVPIPDEDVLNRQPGMYNRIAVSPEKSAFKMASKIQEKLDKKKTSEFEDRKVRLTKSDKADIRKLKAEGMSYLDISLIYKVCRKTIYTVVNDGRRYMDNNGKN